MAKIRSFVYCENIEQQPTPIGPKATIIGPMGEICPIGIPSNFSFAIAFTVVELNLDMVNIVQVQFVSPDENILNDTGNIEIPVLQEKNKRALQLNLQFNNLPLMMEGEYFTKVFINGEVVDTYPITVITGSSM